MDDTALLIFCWHGREYGIPVNNVSGIIGDTRPAASPAAGDAGKAGRPTILLDLDGIQLAVLADEVVKVVAPADLASRTAFAATLRLHQFARPAD